MTTHEITESLRHISKLQVWVLFVVIVSSTFNSIVQPIETESELLLLEYVVKHNMSLPYALVFSRFNRISITQYNGRCQK